MDDIIIAALGAAMVAIIYALWEYVHQKARGRKDYYENIKTFIIIIVVAFASFAQAGEYLPFQIIIPVIIAIFVVIKIDHKKNWHAEGTTKLFAGIIVTVVISVILLGILLATPYTKEEETSAIPILSLKVLPDNGVVSYIYFYSNEEGEVNAEITKESAAIFEKSNRSEIVTRQEYLIRNYPWYLQLLFLKKDGRSLENKHIEIYTNQSLSNI